MTESEITAALTGLFRELLDNPELELKPADQDRDIAGFDSAKKVHLVLAVEERFAIRLHSRKIDMLRSVADWIKVIQAHCTGAA
jgi:acyl carrier protein